MTRHTPDWAPHTFPERRRRLAGAVLGLLAVLGWSACAHGPDAIPAALRTDWRAAPAADPATLGLWRLDETVGVACADDGPQRLMGTYGIDSRPEFGRFQHGRMFKPSMDSWVYVPGSAALDFGAAWSIEAWVKPDAFADVECNVIASRWSPESVDQSWLLGLTGFRRATLSGAPVPPGYFRNFVGNVPEGTVLLIIQPEAASEPRAFTSTLPIQSDRWTHIAVTRDGSLLQFFIDGRLDAQYVAEGGLRPSLAPLVIGNLIDPRWLTEAEGSLRVMNRADLYPFYAFEGTIDEVRLSTESRSTVPEVPR